MLYIEGKLAKIQHHVTFHIGSNNTLVILLYYCNNLHSQQKLRQERQAKGVHVPVKYFMPLDNMGTLRISHKTDAQGKVFGMIDVLGEKIEIHYILYIKPLNML